MEQIRIGVVGCGEIAQIMHLPFLTELRTMFEVRAVCDISSQLVETIGDIFHVPHRFTDYTELLARDDIDAVVVLTADHAPVAIAAAKASKHIFVEKPMCWTVEDGRAMIAAAEESGVTMMVGYMKRYDPGYEYAQRIIKQMENVCLIRIHDLTGRGPLAPQERSTRCTELMIFRQRPVPASRRKTTRVWHRVLASDDPKLISAYGMMLGLSSHDMTVLRGAFGDPVAVRYAEVLADGSIVMAVLEYPNDVRCVWEIGNIPQATRNWFDEELVVYGGGQTVTVQFPNPYVRYAPSHVRVQEMDGTAQSDRTVVASFEEAFRCEWHHFYECVTTGATPRTTAADGLRDVELLRAIVRCAADGKPIHCEGKISLFCSA